MSSPSPSAFNGYTVSADTPLSPVVLNGVFGSVAARLAALEAGVADYEAAIASLTTLGLAQLAANLGPEVTAARATLAALQADYAALEDQIAVILATSLEAVNVTVTADGTLAAGSAQAALAALAARLAALEGGLTALAAALGAKADATAVYTKAQVDAAISAARTSYATLLKYR